MTDAAAIAEGRRRAQQELAYYRVDRMADEYLTVYEAAIRSRNPAARTGGLRLGTSSAPGK